MNSAAMFLEKAFSHRRFNLLACGIISCLVLIAYSNTFTASFHFDDNPSIIENPNIRHVTWDNIEKILNGNRPVVYLSIMLNYQLSGLNVVGWHIFNIGVHIATAVLFYYLMLWTLGLSSAGQHSLQQSRRMSLFAALIFGVHPIQTESVTYIISRSELLAAFFFLATMLIYHQAVVRKKPVLYVAGFITSACAMGSKEWAATLPAMIAVYDLLFFSDGKVKQALQRWYIYVLYAVPVINIFRTVAVFTPGGGGGAGFGMQSVTGLSPLSYFLTSLNVLWTYVRLLILPINQNLDYDYPIARTLFEFPTILSLAGHLAVAGWVLWLFLKKKKPLVVFGVLWFYITISPVQSIVPIVDVIFEHRLYLPCIGFFLLFINLYEDLFAWIERRFAKSDKIPAAEG